MPILVVLVRSTTRDWYSTSYVRFEAWKDVEIGPGTRAEAESASSACHIP